MEVQEVVLGTKETNELIDGAVEAIKLGFDVKAILELDATSEKLAEAFVVLKEQAAKLEIYTAAIKDVSLVKDELKNLSNEELIALLMKLASAVSVIKEEIKQA